MAKLRNPIDIQYLALEGGGGKGVTYLGAIRALEKLQVLPINIDKPGDNQIKGISGASAGAITAMFLALGYTSDDLEKVLSNPSTFTGFFDKPYPGIHRAVDKSNRPTISGIPKKSEEVRLALPNTQLKPTTTAILALLTDTKTAALASYLSNIENLLTVGKYALSDSTDPMLTQLIKDPTAYLYNLLFDRGLFPGLTVRDFLQNTIYGTLREKLERSVTPPGQPRQIYSYNHSEINFERFFRLTGVDLVITGANITRHKPAIFSRRYTPNFPVAEAVGISMNLPFLFKPVFVEATVPKGDNIHPDDYKGMWIDGGILNNFPLHAFDFLSPIVSKEYPNLRPLNPNILGLRLTAGPQSSVRQKSSTFDVLLEHLGNIMDTVLYPSEEGQILSQDERDQTIDLYTYNLETTEFAPPKSKSDIPVLEAEIKVNSYFGKQQERFKGRKSKLIK